MESPDEIEADPYADNIVPVPEGEEQYQEAVGELPLEQGLDGQAGPGTPLGIGGRRWAGWAAPTGRSWCGRAPGASHGERPHRRNFWTPYGLHTGNRGS